MAPQIDDDAPMVHDKPLSGYGSMLLGLGTALAYEAVGAVPPKGSPAALADCERRRLEAIKAAQAVREDIEDRLDSRIPDLPAEYDTDSDSGDENDAWGAV